MLPGQLATLIDRQILILQTLTEQFSFFFLESDIQGAVIEDCSHHYISNQQSSFLQRTTTVSRE